MKKLITLFVCLAGLAVAQPGYMAYYEANLTAAASVVTVQQPATSAARIVRFVGASIYCSVQCDVTLERNGTTAATSTPLVPTPILAATAAAKTKAFSASNVGAGVVLNKFTISAGGTLGIDLSSIALAGSGTTRNLTLRTSSITGIARIAMQFTEEN